MSLFCFGHRHHTILASITTHRRTFSRVPPFMRFTIPTRNAALFWLDMGGDAPSIPAVCFIASVWHGQPCGGRGVSVAGTMVREAIHDGSQWCDGWRLAYSRVNRLIKGCTNTVVQCALGASVIDDPSSARPITTVLQPSPRPTCTDSGYSESSFSESTWRKFFLAVSTSPPYLTRAYHDWGWCDSQLRSASTLTMI